MDELVRLRHRFILILMCSVGLVLTVALVVSVVSSFMSQYGRIQNSLAMALTAEGGDLRPRIGGSSAAAGSLADTTGQEGDQGPGPSPPAQDAFAGKVPVFVVDISGVTGVLTYYGNAADMDASTLTEALARIAQEADSDGLFLDLGLYYSQQDAPEGGTRIAFADASHVYETTLGQALIALLIWVLAMVAFFILSRILSRMALRPVEEAWAKQRQFIANASHELKTPLTIILANNSIIQSRPEKTTAEQRQWLESTAEEANRMNDMVTDLLLLAGLEGAQAPERKPGKRGGASNAGKAGSAGDVPRNSADHGRRDASFPFAVFGLSSLIERSLLQFDSVFFERGLTVESQVEEGLRMIGNREHLRRLVDILLDNASKYSNEDGLVEVRLKRVKDRKSTALLSVSSTGAFVPPGERTQIFERFYRADAAHSDVVPGNGLGLSLAREIVLEHGGSINVTSVQLDAPESLDPLEGLGPSGSVVSSESAASSAPIASLGPAAPSGHVTSPQSAASAEQPARTTFTVTLPLA